MSAVVALLDRLYAALGRWWIVVLFGNLTIVFLIVFALVGEQPPDDAPGVVALQLAFSADRFADITAQWGPQVVDDFRANLWLDYLFPPVYALALAGLIAWSPARRDPHPPYAVLVLFALPFVAAMCDYVENTAHWVALAEPQDPPAALVLLASVAAAIKWALLAVALLVGLVRFVLHVRVRRGFAS